MLDGALAGLATLTVAWIYLINPSLFVLKAPLYVRLTLTAYPAISVFIVALTARLLFSADSRHLVVFHTLLATTVAMLIGDLNFTLVEAHVHLFPTRFMDVPYAFAYVLSGTTVLHPSMRQLTEPVRTEESAPSRGRLAFVAVSLLIPAFVVVARPSDGGDKLALSAIVIAFTVTAIIRMFRALRAHAEAERNLTMRVTHDALTGLPNRVHVLEDIERAQCPPSASTRRSHCCLDLDRFKLVNDTLGHSFGDELLIAVAHRLEATVRPEDIVGRIGGDEFVVLLQPIRDAEEARDLGELVRMAFMQPFLVRGSEMPTSCSIGVAVFDGTATPGRRPRTPCATPTRRCTGQGGRPRPSDGLRHRDAPDRAATGGDRARAPARRRPRSAVGGLPAGVDPVSEQTVGAEALVRWAHPVKGAISPAEFIPVAEETGLINEIGAWVMDESLRQLSCWREEGVLPDRFSMSVNVSARQVRDLPLAQLVGESLQRNGISPEQLVVEITESVMMTNAEAARTCWQGCGPSACSCRWTTSAPGTPR